MRDVKKPRAKEVKPNEYKYVSPPTSDDFQALTKELRRLNDYMQEVPKEPYNYGK